MPLLIDYLKQQNRITPKQAAILNGLGILAVFIGLGVLCYLAYDIKTKQDQYGCAALCGYIEGVDPSLEGVGAYTGVAYNLTDLCEERGYIKNPNPDYLIPQTPPA